MLRFARSLAVFVLAALAATAAAQAGFTLSSSSLEGGTFAPAQVYDGFGCTGGNRSPALSWSGAPAGTESFAITMYDPDAPSGSGWWHWILFDIPPAATDLAEGAGAPGSTAAPGGSVAGPNDFGSTGYGGPCPPAGSGAHHYQITVFALDVAKLDVPKDASAALIGFNLNAHALARARLTVPFSR